MLEVKKKEYISECKITFQNRHSKRKEEIQEVTCQVQEAIPGDQRSFYCYRRDPVKKVQLDQCVG